MLLNRLRWYHTIQLVGNTPHHCVGLVYQEQERPALGLGTIVKVHRAEIDNDKILFIAQGLRRFKIMRWISYTPPYLVEVSYPIDQVDSDADETRAYALSILNGIKELLPIKNKNKNKKLSGEEFKHYFHRFSSHPGNLTDFAAAITSANGASLQKVLETLHVLSRMQVVLPLLRKEIEVAHLQSDISEQVNALMQKRQREFFLREQLNIIHNELGIYKNDRSNDVSAFRKRIDTLRVPERVQARIDEELDKLSVLETGSAEYGTTRNYLDWLTSLPWGITSDDKLDLVVARTVLDRDHDGLLYVKERIIEFIAEGFFRGTVGGEILLLVGPPGIGKTSIGSSIAETLGRKFYRLSVGGMRDEAEIKGHRRTYVGAMPGKLVQSIREVGVVNPVIMLDEIDKLGKSLHGDPGSALLEVLDPEQNLYFLDHYLDVRMDLSKVLFVCTANQLDTIHPALLDRMETISLSGYITEEKFAIAKHHLWPRLLSRSNIERINITDAALLQVIEGYARESGVRQLEKQLHWIVRKAAVKMIETKADIVKVSMQNLETFIGAPIFRNEKMLRGVGVVIGLAWTAMGGATLPIEAGRVHKLTRGLKLTGNLGEVMQESANIAYSYAMAHCEDYDIAPGYFNESFIHLHVPEGATPKDGPSAGVTMTTALLSLARYRDIGRPLAMTGEITLTGQVLPVGGIREKVIAARRGEIYELILPKENQRNFFELPYYLKEDLKVHFVDHYRELAQIVFCC